MTLTIEEYTNTLFQEMIRIFLMILTYFLGIFGYGSLVKHITFTMVDGEEIGNENGINR